MAGVRIYPNQRQNIAKSNKVFVEAFSVIGEIGVIDSVNALNRGQIVYFRANQVFGKIFKLVSVKLP